MTEVSSSRPGRSLTVGARVVRLSSTTRVTARRLRENAGPALRWAAPGVRVVTPVGWTVLALSAVAWVCGAGLGWSELMVVAAAGLLLLALAALLMVGRTLLSVSVVVEPQRVSVGESVTGEVAVTNLAKGVLLPVVLELPVGPSSARFQLPVLRSGARHSELFVVPTDRRAVIPVGPAMTSRGDPLGLFRRDVTWTGTTEIFVHPRLVPLESLGEGLLRDLEGRSVDHLSMSDLAFHTLREYVAGDDLRHVHWRSSAKVGQLLVRQYLDTRRSHLTVVVDNDITAYADPDDYETALSAGASVLVRGAMDDFDVSFVSGEQVMSRRTGRALLDACSRCEPGERSLVSQAATAARLAPDTSLALLVTGAHTPFATLQRAAASFASEARVLTVRVDASAEGRVSGSGDLTVLGLGRLEDLPALLKWGAR